MPIHPEYTLNIGSALSYWNSKLNELKGGSNEVLDILIIGDSITEGGMSAYNGPTDYGGLEKNRMMTYSYAGLLRSYLKNHFGDVGLGVIPSGHPVNANPYVTYSSNWTLNNLAGINMECKISNVLGSTITILFSGTGLELNFVKLSDGGQFSVAIDGGTPSTYTTTGNDNDLLVVETTGLSNGSHSCVVTALENKYVYYNGFRELKGTKGIRVNLASRGGATTVTANTTSTVQLQEYIQPDLTIIELGANDSQQQVPLNTFRTGMQSIITEALKTGDVLLTTIGSNPETYTIPHESYADIIRELAVTNNVALVDTDKNWGQHSGGVTKGYVISGNVHILPKGHDDCFKSVLNCINPRTHSNRTYSTRTHSSRTY